MSEMFNNPQIFILWLIAIITSLSVHEFSHALAATLLGDETAKEKGRLTLNPLAHIDLFGLFALVFVHFGWGKPVPYNPYHLKNRKTGELTIALAGPASNLVMAIISAVILKVSFYYLGGDNLLVNFLAFSFFINIVLMVFNLIPLPPLDGSKMIFYFLNDTQYSKFRYSLEYYGQWVLMGIVFADIVLGLGIIGNIISIPVKFSVHLFGLSSIFGL